MANNQTKLDNNPVGVRSNHNLSYNWLGSADFGRIVPFYWQELLGKDQSKSIKPKFEVQMLPFASPIFGKMDIYCHFFYVPHRLSFKDSGQFFAQTGIGKSAKAPTWRLQDFRSAFNNLASDGIKRSVFKHWTSFGLPPFFNDSRYDSTANNPTKNDELSLLPFRAYNQIWWDFYRDPELISDDSKEMYLRDESGRDTNLGGTLMQYYPKMRMIKDTWLSELFSSNNISSSSIPSETTNMYSYNDFVYTSDSGDTSIKLRKMEALTRMAERLSLSGKREIDLLFSQYGIKPDWQKLNMCEYVGGGKAPIIINDIVSSADTAIDGMNGTPLGQKSASGYSSLNDLTINYTAKEPGILMGVFTIMPKVHYVQGLGKQWYRKTLYDFYRDELEHVGQVAVPNKEIAVNYATGSFTDADQAKTEYEGSKDNYTFGFTQPYYEYKRGTDVLAGDFMFYHNVPNPNDDKDLLYMQSMGMFYDYPKERSFTYENMQVDSVDANQVFYYLGGQLWSNSDDHFHVNVGVENIIERPMDGYAIPTLETTEDPHASKAPIGNSTVL